MELYDSVLRTIAALAAVLGLMALLAWGIRRFGFKPLFGGGSGPLIQVLATASLGPRKSISLVSIAGEVLIIGSSSTELVRLGRVRDPEHLFRAGPLPNGLPVARADSPSHGRDLT